MPVINRGSCYNDPARTFTFQLKDIGDLATATDQDFLTIAGLGGHTGYIRRIYGKAGTKPEGRAAVFDINKNGSTIGDGAVVTFADGQTAGNNSGLNVAVVNGDQLSLDCVTIGDATHKGADVSIAIEVHIPETLVEVSGDAPVTT